MRIFFLLFTKTYVIVLEKGMASHSSTLAWNIPWTEEPGRLQSMGSQRVRHDWVTSKRKKRLDWVPKNWCLQTVVLEKTPESPLDSKDIKSVYLKGDQPEYSLEGLMLKSQYFGYLMQTDNSLEKSLMLGKIEGRGEEGVRGWEMARWHWWCNEHELGQALGDGEGQEGLECCSPWGHKESDTTGQLNKSQQKQ